MLKAIASPHTYRHLTLDRSFCLMTLAAAGYFAVIGGSMLLDRLAERAQEEAAASAGSRASSELSPTNAGCGSRR